MVNGLLQRLAQREVPPPPESFERELNTRLNDRLLASHLVDFTCRALPYTFFEFSRAVFIVTFTLLTGHEPGERRRRRRPDR